MNQITSDAPLSTYAPQNEPCPMCGVEGKLNLVRGQTTVSVRREVFVVQEEKFLCGACGEAFRTPANRSSLEEAYSLYRIKHGLLAPSQLVSWRKELKLSQGELAALLGWSISTVSRYENGALQDDAHDRAMRAAMTLDGLVAVLDAANDLDEATRQKVASYVQGVAAAGAPIVSAVHSNIEAMAKRPVNWTKLQEALVYFCSWSAVPRTKLNKLMFYMDFLRLKVANGSITGLPYIKLQYGPVPVGYDFIYSSLAKIGVLNIEEVEREDSVIYLHRATRNARMDVFTADEVACLTHVHNTFASKSAGWLSDHSHKESGWIETAQGQEIAAHYAASLSLDLPD